MEIIDNVNKTLKEDLTTEIHKGSKVSIAAACFSIYAFAELKKNLKMWMNYVLFLHHQHSLRKKQNVKRGSSIYQDRNVRKICLVRSLKLNYAMR